MSEEIRRQWNIEVPTNRNNYNNMEFHKRYLTRALSIITI